MDVQSIFLLLFFVGVAAAKISTEDTAKPSVDKAPAADSIANKLPQESTIEDEEMKDIQTEWRKDGTVQLNFTSHGRRHHLELTESKMNLSKVDIRLLGSSPDTEVKVKQHFKNMKLMRSQHERAVMAFKTEEGKLSLLPEGGMFRKGKHDFRVEKTAGGVKAVKMPTADHINKTLTDFQGEETRRMKRSSTLDYNFIPVSGSVELVWIIDYSVVSKFEELEISKISNTLSNSEHLEYILIYYAHITDMMNGFFKSMNNEEVQVTVDLAGMVVLSEPTQFGNLVEDYENDGNLDGDATLSRLSEWLASSSSNGVLPPYDHVMLSTAYGMTSTDYTYRGEICDQARSASVVASSGLLSYSALIGTQALARSFGVEKDGTGTSSSCDSSQYIMGDPKIFLDYKFLFSCCSQRSIYSTFYRYGNCLLSADEQPNYNSSYDESVKEFLPGEIFNADDQCYIAFGTKECDNVKYSETGTNICINLYCVSSSDASECVTDGTPALDGTQCAILSWCIQGICELNPPDAISVTLYSCHVTSCYGGEKSCYNGVNKYEPERYRCYNESKQCDGREDCSDGSDEYECGTVPARNCPSARYHTCTTGSLVDKNGYCVEESLVCDGTKHCTDGSDEENCTVSCISGFFQCVKGASCIHDDQVCDANDDCIDGSDELNCDNDQVSGADCYLCVNNACVISAAECDLYCSNSTACVDYFNGSPASAGLSTSAIFLSYLVICVRYLCHRSYGIM